MLLGVYSAYGHHEYLPDLITTDTYKKIHNNREETRYVNSWLSILISSKTLLTVGLIDRLISVVAIDLKLKRV